MYELSELEIFRRELYDPATRQPMKNGVLDPHLVRLSSTVVATANPQF